MRFYYFLLYNSLLGAVVVFCVFVGILLSGAILCLMLFYISSVLIFI